MKPNELLEKALNYSSYVKGAEYSASDLVQEPMMVKLRKTYPELDDIKTEDKIKAFIGTGAHLNFEEFLKHIEYFDEDIPIRSEVKVKYKNLSATIDVVFPDGTVGDWKTGGDKQIAKKIKDPIDWKTQLSVGSFLNHKQNDTVMHKYGYIFWITTDTAKFGTEKIELFTKEETIALIKEFMVNMKKPLEELPQCDGCIYWRYRWCSARSKCPKFGEDENFAENIEEW